MCSIPCQVSQCNDISKSTGTNHWTNVEFLLNRSVWTHGQLYVAMSRIIIYANQSEFEELNLPPNNHYTCNVVYTEVFNLM